MLFGIPRNDPRFQQATDEDIVADLLDAMYVEGERRRADALIGPERAHREAEGENGELHSGWFLKYSHLPARVPAEHSETAYTTTRAMDFMREAKANAANNGGQPWLVGSARA